MSISTFLHTIIQFTLSKSGIAIVDLWKIYPVKDFWQSSSCSSRCGNNCPKVSSPTQHLDNIGCFVRSCHNFNPWLIDVLKTLGFLKVIENVFEISFINMLLLNVYFILLNDCSNILNQFFTWGSCFAISPPTNTASRYTQRFWTVIQFSMISVEFERLDTQSCICLRNGALYLKCSFSSIGSTKVVELTLFNRN